MRSPVRVLGVIVAIAYSLLAARTTPFSTSSDVAAGVPIVLLALAEIVVWVRGRGRGRGGAAGAGAGTNRLIAAGGPWWPWLVAAIAVVGWELENYLAAGSRAAHPTFSSMADAVDRYWLLKALVFLAWLVLGWWIVTRPAAASGRLS
jgi:hypothetical protein